VPGRMVLVSELGGVLRRESFALSSALSTELIRRPGWGFAFRLFVTAIVLLVGMTVGV
jgi:hypothetical protein